MRNLNRERGIPLKPWQEFDMIGGTSRIGPSCQFSMSLDKCESAYSILSEAIFTPIRRGTDPVRVYNFLKANGKFSEEPLENCIQHTVWSKGLSQDALLRDTGPDSCKVFVRSTLGEEGSSGVIRSYVSRRHNALYDIYKI